jgi:hypothetical protein
LTGFETNGHRCELLRAFALLEPAISETGLQWAVTYPRYALASGLEYLLYFTRRRSVGIVMLCGGDKPTQRRDIKRAKCISGEIGDDL